MGADLDLVAAWRRWRASAEPARELLARVADAWAAADRAFAAADEPEGLRAAGASKWLCRRLHGAIVVSEWALPARIRADLAAGDPARIDDELAFLISAGDDRAARRHEPGWIALAEVGDAAQVEAVAAAWDRGGFAPAPAVERALVEAAVRTGRVDAALARLPAVRWPRDRQLAVAAVARQLDAAQRATVVEEALAYVVAEDRLPARYLIEPAVALVLESGALADDARQAWAELIDSVVAAMSAEDQADCPDHRDVRLQLAELWCRLGDEPRAWTWVDRIRDDDRWTAMLALAAVASPAARELLADEALDALGSRWSDDGVDPAQLAAITRCGPAMAAAFVEPLADARPGPARAAARVILAAHAPEDAEPEAALAELSAAMTEGEHEALLDAAEPVVAALDALAAADVAGAVHVRHAFVELVLDSDDPFAWRDVAATVSLDELRALIQLAADDVASRAADEREAIAALCATAIERIAIERIDAGADAVTAAAATELAHELSELGVPLADSVPASPAERRDRGERACIAHRQATSGLAGERWADVAAARAELVDDADLADADEDEDEGEDEDEDEDEDEGGDDRDDAAGDGPAPVELGDDDVEAEAEAVDDHAGALHAAYLADLEAAAPTDGQPPPFLAAIRERLAGAGAMSLLRAEGALAALAHAGVRLDDAYWTWLAHALDRAGRGRAADRCVERVASPSERRGLALELALARRDRTAVRELLRAQCATDATAGDPGQAAERIAAAGHLVDVFAVAREEPSPTLGLFLRLVALAATTPALASKAGLNLPRLRAELAVAVGAARAAVVPQGTDDDRLGALPLAASWVDDATARALWADAFSAAARARPCWPGWRADSPARVLARVAGPEALAALAAVEDHLEPAG